MLFTWDINIPKNTTKDDPEEEKLELAHGIITWVSVLFPPGCHRLAQCAIFHHEHQIFPSRSDQSLSGDTFPLEWTEYYEMYQPPYDLLARCWNDDDTYPHKITIRIAVLPRKAVMASAIVDAIKGILGLLSPRKIFTKNK